MSGLQTLKSWIGALTELGLMLLALGIVCALLVGGANMPFFGNVAGNITAFVKDLGLERPGGLDRPRRHPVAVLEPQRGMTAAAAPVAVNRVRRHAAIGDDYSGGEPHSPPDHAC